MHLIPFHTIWDFYRSNSDRRQELGGLLPIMNGSNNINGEPERPIGLWRPGVTIPRSLQDRRMTMIMTVLYLTSRVFAI